MRNISLISLIFLALLAGCAHKPKVADSYVVLMENADGSTGAITYRNKQGKTAAIDQAGTGVKLEDAAAGTYAVPEEKIAADFFDATAARPAAPVSFMLYFESGDVKLTAESEALLKDVLQAVEDHPAPSISIIGHTDTVGNAADNQKLGLERAQAIAGMVKATGINLSDITVTSHGERNLLVATPDNTEEEKNRRVEISVR